MSAKAKVRKHVQASRKQKMSDSQVRKLEKQSKAKIESFMGAEGMSGTVKLKRGDSFTSVLHRISGEIPK